MHGTLVEGHKLVVKLAEGQPKKKGNGRYPPGATPPDTPDDVRR